LPAKTAFFLAVSRSCKANSIASSIAFDTSAERVVKGPRWLAQQHGFPARGPKAAGRAGRRKLSDDLRSPFLDMRGTSSGRVVPDPFNRNRAIIHEVVRHAPCNRDGCEGWRDCTRSVRKPQAYLPLPPTVPSDSMVLGEVGSSPRSEQLMQRSAMQTADGTPQRVPAKLCLQPTSTSAPCK